MDIGLDKNGFLHADDLVFPGVEVARRGRSGRTEGQAHRELLRARARRSWSRPSRTRSRPRAPRLSMQLSIAGRYLVYVPQGEGVGVSRRPRRQGARPPAPGGGQDRPPRGRRDRPHRGGQGAKREDFERELKYLHKLNDVLQKRGDETVAPAMVFQEADLSVRVVRDIFSGDFESAIVDDEKQYQRLVSFFTRTAPELVDRVELYEDAEPLFERYGVEEVIESTCSAPRGPAQRRLPDDRLRRGADGHRRELRLVHRPRQGRAPRGHDHQDQPRGRRRGRATSCGCATSAGSSSSTSSTWRGRATATRS